MGSVVTVAALPRGQLKSSARPVGAAIGSPLVSTRIASGSAASRPRGRARTAQELLGGTAGRRDGQRNDRADQRTRRRPARLGAGRSRLDARGQRHRNGAIGHAAVDLALHVVGELAGAGLGEIDAVGAAQAAGLTLEIRPLRRVAALLVDKAVPDIDIDDAGLLGPAAIELVEIGGVRGRLGAALRRQADPEHRHAAALQCRDGRVDPLDIGGLPLVGMELERTGRRRPCRRLRARAEPDPDYPHSAFATSSVGAGAVSAVWPGAGLRSGRGRGLPRRRRRAARGPLANRLVIVGPDHHHDEFRLLGRDDLARGLRPVHVTAGIVADQAGGGAVLAGDADLRPLREGVLEPIAEPIRHRVAHDHDRCGGRHVGSCAPAATGAWELSGGAAGRCCSAGPKKPPNGLYCCCCGCCWIGAGGRRGGPNGDQNCAWAGDSSAIAKPAAATISAAPSRRCRCVCAPDLSCTLMIRLSTAFLICAGTASPLKDGIAAQTISPSHDPADGAGTTAPYAHRHPAIVRQKCQLEDGRKVTRQAPAGQEPRL